MEGDCGTEEDHGESQLPVLLIAHVWVEEFAGDRDGGESKGWRLVIQWKHGHDVQAFDSMALRAMSDGRYLRRPKQMPFPCGMRRLSGIV